MFLSAKNTINLKDYSYKGGEEDNEYRKPGEIYFSMRYNKSELEWGMSVEMSGYTDLQ